MLLYNYQTGLPQIGLPPHPVPLFLSHCKKCCWNASLFDSCPPWSQPWDPPTGAAGIVLGAVVSLWALVPSSPWHLAGSVTKQCGDSRHPAPFRDAVSRPDAAAAVLSICCACLWLAENGYNFMGKGGQSSGLCSPCRPSHTHTHTRVVVGAVGAILQLPYLKTPSAGCILLLDDGR